jgi:uncharacterized protein Veg
MRVTKTGTTETLNKGEIVGLSIQVGSKRKNEKAPVFAEKYKRVEFKYFIVKEVDRSKIILIDLDTKEELNLVAWRGVTINLIHTFKEKIREKLSEVDLGYRCGKLEADEKTYSAIVSIYPSFTITSLSNSTMNEDGTFTFTIKDVDGVHLDKLARFKRKEMLKHF